jgi:uncharacterized protein YneF (UPF0154 family)
MKRFKNIILSIFFIAFMLEAGLLVGEFYIYNKYKTAHLNINGRIVCELDNLINFSGLNK